MRSPLAGRRSCRPRDQFRTRLNPIPGQADRRAASQSSCSAEKSGPGPGPTCTFCCPRALCQPFNSCNVTDMAAAACAVCGRGFSARSDAVYCSSACRQKQHRARTAERVAVLRDLATRSVRAAPATSDVAPLIVRARRNIDHSRELCRLGALRMQRSAEIQHQFSALRRSLSTEVAADAYGTAAATPVPS
jgi:hypothetical protein